MKLDTRSKKTTVNAISNIINKVVIAICGFIVRTILINTLGKEYLGINGLFSSIISMLSLADLGIGIALPFSLYGPLAKEDNRKIMALMNLYSKIYTIIGVTVFVLGISLLPFLDNIVNTDINIENLHFIYVLFVINSSISYFWVYRRTLITADQKGYIINNVSNIVKIILMIAQIIILLLFKNYILYFSTNIIFAVIENLIISTKCTKLYPYLKNNDKEIKLNKTEIKEIWKNSYALIFYKICNVVIGSTDNIMINCFCGIVTVGIYSNYLLIIDTIQSVTNQVFNALTSSIGNLVSSESKEKSYQVFNTLNFFCFSVFGICSICLLYLSNDFINIWIGNDYILPIQTVIVIVINFYLIGCQSVTSAYRTAYGLFWQGRYRPIIGVIVNIIASIALGKYMGLIGVLLGTTISRVSVLIWYDALIVHKYGFEKSIKPYYKQYIYFFIVFIIMTIIEYPISKLIYVNSYIMFVVKTMALIGITIVVLFVLFHNKSEYRMFIEYIKNIVGVKKKEV